MLESLFRRLVTRGSGEESDPSGDDVRTDGGTVTKTATESTGGSQRSWRESEFVRSLPFWLPPALLMGLFVYGAIGWNAVISLTEWEGFGSPDYGNLDFSMYARMLADPTFVAAARNTVVLLVAFTVVSLVVGLLVAILVDRGIRFENTLRTVYLLPMSLSFVVTAIFWAWMYNPEFGLINVVLRGVGLGFLANDWISDPSTKLAAVIFALMWQFSGYCMVVYLAGLRAIPSDQFEAARIDGASTLRMYWRVIIPQLRASTMSAAVVLMVFALKAFDFLYVMFGDTPGPSTDILATMMFREAFSSSNWAYGAAIATVLFGLALVVIGPYLYVQYQRGDL
ncbi:sugar ABC transporter permease [Halogeometricum pallidum JCM 14848]|uniref:Sugar ABC transporter permease n=1 Tax=Halogeometricum pallidum JCM 14848 TaxID=1227487 RepID=M0DK12_HALPD|nr:sugar ABC transporter permease [Halogeometricum pallidum]ELZ35022.1 sugar ABC transporter permease [Halogeometricum pallidum JCM 14848]